MATPHLAHLFALRIAMLLEKSPAATRILSTDLVYEASAGDTPRGHENVKNCQVL
jgi:hypothetical protein